MRIALRTSAMPLTLAAMSALGLYGQTKPDTGKLVSSLSGNWKEDQSQRKLGSAGGLHFRTTASGGLEELRGPEARPMVQSVKLDGKSYDMEGGNSMIWKQIDANSFERRTALKGKLLSVRRIRISNDGKTLLEESERHAMDGRVMKATADFSRTSGDAQGLAGKWQLVKVRNSEPLEVKYEAAGPNAMKVTGGLGQSYTLAFGKTSAITGPNVVPGMTIAAAAVDDHTIETTTTREGVTAAKARIVLSDGGKVMTVTTTPAGADSSRRPSVIVYKKQ